MVAREPIPAARRHSRSEDGGIRRYHSDGTALEVLRSAAGHRRHPTPPANTHTPLGGNRRKDDVAVASEELSVELLRRPSPHTTHVTYGAVRRRASTDTRPERALAAPTPGDCQKKCSCASLPAKNAVQQRSATPASRYYRKYALNEGRRAVVAAAAAAASPQRGRHNLGFASAVNTPAKPLTQRDQRVHRGHAICVTNTTLRAETRLPTATTTQRRAAAAHNATQQPQHTGRAAAQQLPRRGATAVHHTVGTGTTFMLSMRQICSPGAAPAPANSAMTKGGV